jgi:hypothetical protein
MSDARRTRRDLLRGAAAAGAASLVAPATAWPTQLAGKPPTFSHWVGSLTGESGPIPAPARFSLVGVQWAPGAARAHVRIELRVRDPRGSWSPWALASVLGHGPDLPAGRHGPAASATVGEPIWTGPAQVVQLRTSTPLKGVRLHFVSAEGGLGATARAGDSAAAALPLARPILDAGPGQPPIIARRAWDHRKPPVPLGYGRVRLAFVHHTETPNGYAAGEVPAMLRSIYVFHRYTRGWHDIGYNFAIDAFGRIWEARAGGIDEAVVGAQAGAYNLESTGVAVLGSFMSEVPPPAAIDALQRLLAWKLSLHGVPARGRVTVTVDPKDAFYTPFAPGAHVSLPRVAGHRDGDSTSCPGDAFYARLPAIRPQIAALAGTPARLTVKAPRRHAPGTPLVVSGRLALLNGQPLGGAPIELQRLTSRGARTIATTTTSGDGSWSVAVALTRTTRLRALHRPAPAAVSVLVEVRVGRRR